MGKKIFVDHSWPWPTRPRLWTRRRRTCFNYSSESKLNLWTAESQTANIRLDCYLNCVRHNLATLPCLAKLRGKKTRFLKYFPSPLRFQIFASCHQDMFVVLIDVCFPALFAFQSQQQTKSSGRRSWQIQAQTNAIALLKLVTSGHGGWTRLDWTVQDTGLDLRLDYISRCMLW